MRQSFTLLATVLLGVTALACGSGSAVHSTATRTAAGGHPNSGYSKDDGDNDADDTRKGKPPNDDLELLASYGRTASPSETRTIAALVKHYYAASAAEDGATVCSLLTASLATGVPAQSASGNASGRTCAATMTALLAREHKQLLADQVSTMTVTTARIKGTLALAVIAFKAAPESDIILEREGSAWKIGALFGSDMT